MQQASLIEDDLGLASAVECSLEWFVLDLDRVRAMSAESEGCRGVEQEEQSLLDVHLAALLQSHELT